MLDINHPISKLRFAASRAEGAILTAAKEMTVASRQERARLRESCQSDFAELRRLAPQFHDYPLIPSNIDALEDALTKLAELPNVPEGGPPADFVCPACSQALERLGKFGFPEPNRPTDIYCSACTDLIMPALQALRSCDVGFGTEAI